jgi:predicted TIM-barrel enzyme
MAGEDAKIKCATHSTVRAIKSIAENHELITREFRCSGSGQITDLKRQGLHYDAYVERFNEINAESDKLDRKFVEEVGIRIIEEKLEGRPSEVREDAIETLNRLAQYSIGAAAEWLHIIYEQGPKQEILGDKFICNVTALDPAALLSLLYSSRLYGNTDVLARQEIYTQAAAKFADAIGPEAASEWYRAMILTGNVADLTSNAMVRNDDMTKLALGNAGLATEMFLAVGKSGKLDGLTSKEYLGFISEIDSSTARELVSANHVTGRYDELMAPEVMAAVKNGRDIWTDIVRDLYAGTHADQSVMLITDGSVHDRGIKNLTEDLLKKNFKVILVDNSKKDLDEIAELARQNGVTVIGMANPDPMLHSELTRRLASTGLSSIAFFGNGFGLDKKMAKKLERQGMTLIREGQVTEKVTNFIRSNQVSTALAVNLHTTGKQDAGTGIDNMHHSHDANSVYAISRRSGSTASDLAVPILSWRASRSKVSAGNSHEGNGIAYTSVSGIVRNGSISGVFTSAPSKLISHADDSGKRTGELHAGTLSGHIQLHHAEKADRQISNRHSELHAGTGSGRRQSIQEFIKKIGDSTLGSTSLIKHSRIAAAVLKSKHALSLLPRSQTASYAMARHGASPIIIRNGHATIRGTIKQGKLHALTDTMCDRFYSLGSAADGMLIPLRHNINNPTLFFAISKKNAHNKPNVRHLIHIRTATALKMQYTLQSTLWLCRDSCGITQWRSSNQPFQAVPKRKPDAIASLGPSRGHATVGTHPYPQTSIYSGSRTGYMRLEQLRSQSRNIVILLPIVASFGIAAVATAHFL